MDYVAGFLFSGDREQVMLVEKIRPDRQRGRLNGVGEKIEPSDASPSAAMIREFEGEIRHGDLAHFFRSFANGPVGHVSGMEDEEVSANPVSRVAHLNAMPNLRWLIPMALDGALHARVDYAT